MQILETLELFNKYLTNYRLLNQKTINRYLKTIEWFHLVLSVKYNKQYEIKNLTFQDVMDFMVALKQKKRTVGGKKAVVTSSFLGASTICQFMTVINHFFKFCNSMGRSPITTIPSPKYPKRLPVKKINPDNIQKMIDICDDEVSKLIGLRNKLIFMFGFYCGLRSSELLSLKFSDIQNGYAVIQGKGQTNKPIRINPLILSTLAEYNNSRAVTTEIPEKSITRMRIIKYDLGSLVNDFIFVSFNKKHFLKPLKTNTLGLVMRDYGKRVGEGDFCHFHLLRHAFGCEIYNKTGDIFATSELMRHQNVKSTQPYVTSYSGRIEAIHTQVFG